MPFLKKIKGGVYNGIGFILVLGLTGVAYGAYVAMTDVTTGQTLTASTFNIVQENIRVLKTTVDGIGSGVVPTGFVGAFNLASCPSGWIAADGTASTPDLRGTFIRGMNGSVNGRDVSRTLGDYQVDDFKSHSHGGVYTPSGSSVGDDRVSNISSMNGTTGLTGGTETRPKNVALLYCVKQ